MTLVASAWELVYGWQLFPISLAALFLFLFLINWADKKSKKFKPFRAHLETYDIVQEGDTIYYKGERVLVLEYDLKTGIAWVTRNLDPHPDSFWKNKK